jgi:hypothetical protein
LIHDLPHRFAFPRGRTSQCAVSYSPNFIHQIQSHDISNYWQMFPPLLEERAGVRTDNPTVFRSLRPATIFNPHRQRPLASGVRIPTGFHQSAQG